MKFSLPGIPARRLASVFLVLCGLLVAVNAAGSPLFPRTFEPIPSPPQSLRGVAVADFNNDGHLDLAAAAFRFDGSEHSGFVHVYLGDGDGGFTALEPFDSDDAPWDVAAADFDADGNMDLATANYRNLRGVSIYLGNGDGTFDLETVYPGTQNGSVAIGDFNGDDVPDLLGVPGMLLLGDGDGGFDTYAASSGSYFTGVADLDGDGLDDYAYPRQLSGDVRVMLSNGNGNFTQAALPLVGDDPRSVTAGDVSGDGIPDLLVANEASFDLSVLLGNGDGSFAAEQRYTFSAEFQSSPPQYSVIHDLDGDGLQDIIVANLSGRLALLYGTGVGQFSAAVDSAESIGLSYELGPGDFDGDGALDLARPSESDNVSWLSGDGRGGFVDVCREEAGVTPSDVIAVDLDGDGRLDLVTTNAGSDDLSVLLGDGAATFAPEQRFCVEAALPPCPAGSDPSALRAGELTGDLHLDLAVANAGTDSVSILAGDGSGGFSFVTSVTVYTGMAPSYVALGDLNNDDDLDLVVVGEGSSLLGVYLGDGAGGFSAPPGFPTGVGVDPVAVALGDLDGDGLLDVLVANSGSDNVTVLLGDGDGTFTSAPTVPSGDKPTDVALGDVNHDSLLDLAVADLWGNTVYVYPGSGDGSFGTPTVLDSGGYSVKIADLDGDGNQEIVVEFGHSYLFRGNGDGSFAARESYLGGGKRFALGDYNLDSRLDWAGVGIRVSILLNQSGPEALGFEADGVTLSWPAENGALSYDIYRGDLSSLVDGNGDGLPDAGYGSCRTQDDDDPRDTFFEDTELPSAAGTGFFYLMSVIDSAGDGGLGTTSAGLPRVPAVPCP